MRHTGNAAPVRAGIYCRISRAEDGDATKTDDQERICRLQAEQIGWEIAEGAGHPYTDGVYTDHNKSAWQKNRKRPAWDRMLEDVAAGKINAIVVYHGDRLVRRPEDLADLLRLADSKGVQLASPTGTRDLDKDRLELWVRAAFAEEESQRTSERRKTQYERWRREGRVFSGGYGGRRFGYTTSGLELYPACRCDVATRQEISEADIMREAAARTLAGESQYSIVKDLAARGWTSPAGRRLRDTGLRELLANPRYAGLMPDGENKGAWPAVLDRETWERLQPLVRTRARPPVRTRWLLSGIACCGICGQFMDIAHITTRGYKTLLYGCRRTGGCGKVWRSAMHLDAYVQARVVRLLGDPAQPEGRLPAPPDLMPEWAILQREHEETEKAIADYATSAGHLTPLARRLSAIKARMAELREREAGDARSRLLGHHRGITAAQFAALPLDVRRALVAASFRITVLPASGRGPGFRTEDVRLEPL